MTEWDLRFLKLAQFIATWSKDPSTKVGAVIVRPDKTIASTGFNGFAMSMEDKPEYLENRDEKYSRIIHGEMNALIFSKEDVKGYTMYSSLMPCDRCFVHLVQSGISRFVYPESPPHVIARWQESFNKVLKYATETGVEMVELNEHV